MNVRRKIKKKSNLPSKQKKRFGLTLAASTSKVVLSVFAFALIIFAVIVVSLFRAGKLGRLDFGGIWINLNIEDWPWTLVGTVFGIVLITFVISLLIGVFPLKPVDELIDSMDKLSKGDYKTRLHFGKAVSKNKAFKDISESFNKLAEELENTETLRSDFINNFSHEFKTPIVSIAGLAKLVNKGNLTEEQKAAYLTAIEEESMRLASMATNVLELTRVENQAILTDVTRFNLSEQIRSCILLLENKWVSKGLDIQLDFEEYYIEANEELLKQIWINLSDNAIKFSPNGGAVGFEIIDGGDRLTVLIRNEGEAISPDRIKKIWNKFYQADESHAHEGNGIGLAVVKRITELHEGEAHAECENGLVTFSVTLPKMQK